MSQKTRERKTGSVAEVVYISCLPREAPYLRHNYSYCASASASALASARLVIRKEESSSIHRSSQVTGPQLAVFSAPTRAHTEKHGRDSGLKNRSHPHPHRLRRIFEVSLVLAVNKPCV